MSQPKSEAKNIALIKRMIRKHDKFRKSIEERLEIQKKKLEEKILILKKIL